MAQQIIDTTTDNGTYTGDPAKTAFTKVNANDTELFTRMTATEDVANAALPKAGGTIDGYLTITSGTTIEGEVTPGHVNIGGNVGHGAGTKYLRFYSLADKTNATIQILGSGGSAGNDGTLDVYCGSLNVQGGYLSSKGVQVRAGTEGSTGPNHYNFYWSSSQLHSWVDNVDLGYVTFSGSDKRIKQDVQYISDFKADLDVILSLKPVEFRYKEGSLWDDGNRHRSFLADDAYVTDPMLTNGVPGQTNEDGSIMPMGLNPNAFFSILVGAIQAQNGLIQQVSDRITALEAPQPSPEPAGSGS